MERTLLLPLAGLLAVILASPPQAGLAKGRDLSIFPAEAAWGDAVYLDGFNWPGQRVDIRARFAPTRAELAAVPLERVVLTATLSPKATFLERFIVSDIPGRRAGPGWVEFVARTTDAEAHAWLVITAEGRRPPGAGFITGQLSKVPTSAGPTVTATSPPSTHAVMLGVAPAADPTAVRWQHLGDSHRIGEAYRTDFLDDGEWLVGPLDAARAPSTVVLGSGITSLEVEMPDLGRTAVWAVRRVTIRAGQPVAGVDFVLARSGTAATLGEPAATPGPLAAMSAGQATPTRVIMAEALLASAGGGVLLLISAGLYGWRRRRRAASYRDRPPAR